MKHFIEHISEDTTVRLDAFITERTASEPYLNVARPAVIVCPGGRYQGCSDREAEPIVLQYAAAGFQVFLLRYTVGKKAVFPASLIDLGKTIRYVRNNAHKLDVISNQIAVCGFSAGGHLAASLGVYWNDPQLLSACGSKGRELRPDLLILGYPVISTSWMHNSGYYASIAGSADDQTILKKLNLHTAVNSDTPPSFIHHGVADSAVPVRDSLQFASALDKNNVPFEMHLFSHAPHGYSAADDTCCSNDWIDPTIAKWLPLSIAWMKRNFLGGELDRPVEKAVYSSQY